MGSLKTIILFLFFVNISYSQVYKIPVPNVRFGSGVPVAMSTDKENDTYIRTDDGLYTGTFLEEYVFDKNYGAWILCTLATSPVGVSSLTTDYINGVLTTTIDGIVYDTSQIPTSGGGTDDQKIDTFTIVSNTLRLSLEDDNEAFKSVSLSPYLDNTDSQTVDTFSYSSDTLRLSLSGDGQLYNKIYIPQITDTDNQTIDTFDIAANVLRISLQDDAQAFKSVNLATYLDNTDAQTLTWTSGTGDLAISGGNTVNLDGRYLLSEVDGSTTNEIQTIDTFSFASKNLKISLSSDNIAASNVYLGQFLDTATAHSGDVTGIYSNLQLGASTVTTNEIGNGEVSTIDLADSVITSVKLISNSVGTTALASGSVTTLKLADSSVTAIKVISNSIDSIQLKSTGVTKGNYTSANIYVDIDGRIISASNGTGGGGSMAPIRIGWDGQGGVVSTGSTRYYILPYACTITGWSIVATGTSPTTTIDVWRVSTGTSLPTVANTIMGTKPALSTGNAVRSTTLTGWSPTSFSAGDILGFSIDALANATTLVFSLEIQ